MKVELVSAEATILHLQEGEVLVVAGEFAATLQETVSAAGHETTKVLVVSAEELELRIVRPESGA